MSASYSEYLMARYQGEVFGEALFAGLARRAADPGAQRKWRQLEELETRTKQRIRPALERLGLGTEEDAARRQQGETLAERLAAVPWLELMQGMRAEFEKIAGELHAAESLAPAGEEALARAITAHERALVEFAEREIEGRGGESLEPIRAILA